MSSKLADAFVEVSAQRSKLTTGLNAARAEVNQFATATSSRMMGLGKSLLAVGGVTGGLFALGAALEKAGDKAASVAKLNTALRITGQGDQIPKLKEFAEGLRQIYGISGGESRELMRLAINLGATGENIQELTALGIGLGEALGTDAAGGIEALHKAQEGNYRAFEKMFPAMKALNTDEEKLAYVAKIAARGLAEKRAATETLKGSLDRMHQSASAVTTAVGELIATPVSFVFDRWAETARAFTGSTEESTRAALGLDLAMLKLSRAGAEALGDPVAIQQIQARIDASEKLMQESMQRTVNAANKAGNLEVTAKLRANKEIEDSTKHTFEKIEDIYKDAQEAALKGTNIIGVMGGGNGAPAVPNPLVPAGGLQFKGAGAAGARAPIDERERLQDRASRLREMAAQSGEAKAAELNAKADALDRRATNYPRGEREPSAAQRTALDMAEIISGDRPLRVKDENAEALMNALKTLTAAIPQWVGRYSEP